VEVLTILLAVLDSISKVLTKVIHTTIKSIFKKISRFFVIFFVKLANVCHLIFLLNLPDLFLILGRNSGTL